MIDGRIFLTTRDKDLEDLREGRLHIVETLR